MVHPKQTTYSMLKSPVQEKGSKNRANRSCTGREWLIQSQKTLYQLSQQETVGKTDIQSVHASLCPVHTDFFQEMRHHRQYGSFIQIFRDVQDNDDKCKSCERGAGPFHECRKLMPVDDEDPPEQACGNCTYAGDRFCFVGDGT